MLSTRRILACTAALALAAATPAMAAPAKKLPKAKPLVIVDQAGDANGINNQGGLVPVAVPTQTGQGGRTAGDLLGISLGRLDNGKAVTGLKVTMTLAAAPDQGTNYRIYATTTDCGVVWFEYKFAVGGAGKGNMRDNCTDAAVNTEIPASVKDGTISWELPFKSLPKSFKVGTVLSEIDADTRGYASATAPVIDQTDVAPGTYKIGQ